MAEHTKAVHGDASIIDENIDAIRVFGLEKIGKLFDAVCLANVKGAKLDGCVAAILGKDLRVLQLGIIVQGLDCFSASFSGTSSQVYEERS